MTVKFQHEREMLLRLPDGSQIYVDRYREDPLCPWIYGMYTVICGSCTKPIAEEKERDLARIRYLEHALEHTQEELMRLHNLVRVQNVRS